MQQTVSKTQETISGNMLAHDNKHSKINICAKLTRCELSKKTLRYQTHKTTSTFCRTGWQQNSSLIEQRTAYQGLRHQGHRWGLDRQEQGILPIITDTMHGVPAPPEVIQYSRLFNAFSFNNSTIIQRLFKAFFQSIIVQHTTLLVLKTHRFEAFMHDIYLKKTV